MKSFAQVSLNNFFSNLLYFLNFCKIENLIQENILRFNKKYDIVGIVEKKIIRRDGEVKE